jgi:hypothetical protein
MSRQGRLEALQEDLAEIQRHGKVTQRNHKAISGEVLRSQLFMGEKGFLHIDAEIEGKEIKPKFEKIFNMRGCGKLSKSRQRS